MAKDDPKIIIGERVLSDAVEKFEAILMQNQGEINEAYLNPDNDNKLTLPFQLRFTAPKTGVGVNVRVSTSAAVKKIKSSSATVVKETQGKLPMKKKSQITGPEDNG